MPETTTHLSVHCFLYHLPPAKEEVYVFARVLLSVCLSVCEQDYSKMRAWIWIKCCMSWMNWLTFEPDPHHSLDPGTGFTPDVCISASWRSYGWISMKFNGSIAMGDWTNRLGFELNPDKSSDPGTRFTTYFWISAGYLKKLWTDLDEIFYVDSCWGLHDLFRFWAGSGS